MSRLEVFGSMARHAMLGRIFNRLKPDETALAIAFIERHEGSSKDQFERAINRMFLDKPNKPKHWKEICELLSCTNSALP